MKYRMKLNLQLFSDEAPGVEEAPAAVEQSSEVTEPETGVEETAAAEQKEPNNYEKAFAKRLSAEKAKWENEANEKFKGYDDYKYLAEYMQQANNGADMLTLKEQIELERLQQRADQANVPPDVLKRIDELEAKAAKAEEYEQQQAQQTELQQFRSSLEAFAKEKGANVDELHQYMFDNQIASPEVAYKAMRAEQLEKELATAKETAVKEYLQSKASPKVEGNGTPGVVNQDPSKMEWGDIRQRAMARIQAATQSQ